MQVSFLLNFEEGVNRTKVIVENDRGVNEKILGGKGGEERERIRVYRSSVIPYRATRPTTNIIQRVVHDWNVNGAMH